MSRSLTGGRPAREKEINEIRKSTDCTTGKMIFTKLRDKNVALLVNSGGIAAVRVLRSNASKLGGIYLGKIQNVAKNIDACFVEIAPGELCFLPLREAGTAHLTNRQPDGSLKAGDELVVMVTRDAQKTKRASVTTDPSRMKQQLIKNGSTPEDASEALQSLLNQALDQWEHGEEPLQSAVLQDNKKERTLAIAMPESLFHRVEQYVEAHNGVSKRVFVVGLVAQELQSWLMEQSPDEVQDQEFGPDQDEQGFGMSMTM